MHIGGTQHVGQRKGYIKIGGKVFHAIFSRTRKLIPPKQKSGRSFNNVHLGGYLRDRSALHAQILAALSASSCRTSLRAVSTAACLSVAETSLTITSSFSGSPPESTTRRTMKSCIGCSADGHPRNSQRHQKALEASGRQYGSDLGPVQDPGTLIRGERSGEQLSFSTLQCVRCVRRGSTLDHADDLLKLAGRRKRVTAAAARDLVGKRTGRGFGTRPMRVLSILSLRVPP